MIPLLLLDSICYDYLKPPPGWLRDETRDRQRDVENAISENRHEERVGLPNNREGSKTFTERNSNCPTNSARVSSPNKNPSLGNLEEEIDHLASQNEERQLLRLNASTRSAPIEEANSSCCRQNQMKNEKCM